MSSTDSTFRTPTDRGFAVVQNMDDGTKEVMVCDGVSGGQPKNVYAVHFKCQTLKVDPGVRLEHTSTTSFTRQIVEVFAEGPGVVYLRAVGHGRTLALEAEALQG